MANLSKKKQYIYFTVLQTLYDLRKFLSLLSFNYFTYYNFYKNNNNNKNVEKCETLPIICSVLCVVLKRVNCVENFPFNLDILSCM